MAEVKDVILQSFGQRQQIVLPPPFPPKAPSQFTEGFTFGDDADADQKKSGKGGKKKRTDRFKDTDVDFDNVLLDERCLPSLKGGMWIISVVQDQRSGYEMVHVTVTEGRGEPAKIKSRVSFNLDDSFGLGNAIAGAAVVDDAVVFCCTLDTTMRITNGKDVSVISRTLGRVSGLAGVAPPKIASSAFAFIAVAHAESSQVSLLSIERGLMTQYGGDENTSADSPDREKRRSSVTMEQLERSKDPEKYDKRQRELAVKVAYKCNVAGPHSLDRETSPVEDSVGIADIALRGVMNAKHCQGFVVFVLLDDGSVLRVAVDTNFRSIDSTSCMKGPASAVSAKTGLALPPVEGCIAAAEHPVTGAIRVMATIRGVLHIIEDNPEVKVVLRDLEQVAAEQQAEKAKHADPKPRADGAPQPIAKSNVCLPALRLSKIRNQMFRNYPAYRQAQQLKDEAAAPQPVEMSGATVLPPLAPATPPRQLRLDNDAGDGSMTMPSPISPPTRTMEGTLAPGELPPGIATDFDIASNSLRSPRSPLSPRSPRSPKRQQRPVVWTHTRPLLDDDHSEEAPQRETQRNTSLVYPSASISLPSAPSAQGIKLGRRSVLSLQVVHTAAWVVCAFPVGSSRSAEVPTGAAVGTLTVVDLESVTVAANEVLPVDVSGKGVYSAVPLTNSKDVAVLWTACSVGGDVELWHWDRARAAAGRTKRAGSASPSPAMSPRAGLASPRRSGVLTSPPTSPLLSPRSRPVNMNTSVSDFSMSFADLPPDPRSGEATAALAQRETLRTELATTVTAINATPLPQPDPEKVRLRNAIPARAAKIRNVQNRAATELWAKVADRAVLSAAFHRWLHRRHHAAAIARNDRHDQLVQKFRDDLDQYSMVKAFHTWAGLRNRRSQQREALRQCQDMFSLERSQPLQDLARDHYKRWETFAKQRIQREVLERFLGTTLQGQQRRAFRAWLDFAQRRRRARNLELAAGVLARSIASSGDRVLRKEAYNAWHRYAATQTKIKQRSALVALFSSSFEGRVRRQAYDRWTSLIQRKKEFAALEDVAAAFSQRNDSLLRARVFRGWQRSIQRTFVRRRSSHGISGLLRSSFDSSTRRDAYNSWLAFVETRREERKRVQQCAAAILTETSSGLTRVYFRRWAAFHFQLAELASSRESNAAAFLRNSSNPVLRETYFRKLLEFSKISKSRRERKQNMMQVLRFSSNGLRLIYQQKWRKYASEKRAARQRSGVLSVFARSSEALMTKIYFQKWLAMQRRIANRRRCVETVETLSVKNTNALLSRYLGKWMQHVFTVCSVRSKDQLNRLNEAERERRRIERGNIEKKELLENLFRKAMHVESENKTQRHMIARTKVHTTLLKQQLEAADEVIARVESTTKAQKAERKTHARTLSLRRYFYNEGEVHANYWNELTAHLNEMETALDQLNVQQRNDASSRTPTVSPLRSPRNSRLETLLTTNAPVRTQTVEELNAAAIERGPSRAPVSPRSDQTPQPEETAPKPLTQPSKRRWILGTLDSVGDLVSEARNRLKASLTQRVQEDDRHWLNVEGVVLGARPVYDWD